MQNQAAAQIAAPRYLADLTKVQLNLSHGISEAAESFLCGGMGREIWSGLWQDRKKPSQL